MNRTLTWVGLLIAVVGSILFYGVFVNLTPGFVAFLAALAMLPIGSGVLFYGVAYRGTYSVPTVAGGGGGGSKGTVWAALAVAVVAILLAVASLTVALGAQSTANSNTTNTSTNSNLNAMISSLGTKPTTVAWKIDWCNTDNTGQDRFCPNEIVVNQGDVVQIMFLHNDTDVHTFTLDTGPYNFQINGSMVGMHDFLTNLNLVTACTNGAYAAESAAISGQYCVSGTSLMAPGGNFRIAQNTNPANSPPNLVTIPMDNTVHQLFINDSVAEVYGVGSFQATTPGIYEFFCHYHVSNGMFGYLIVLPNTYCTTNPSSCGVTGSS